jgi:hypothetical protein
MILFSIEWDGKEKNKLELNQVAARRPAKAVAQFFFQ